MIDRRLWSFALCLLLLSTVSCGGGPSSSGRSEATPAARGGAPMRIKVLTYNIHHGEGTDDRFDLQRIARLVKRTGADLVAMQEVDRRTRRSGGIDQPKQIADALGMEYAFAEAIPFQGGQYGEAVFSRFPFAYPRRVPLPAPPDQEARAALEVVVQPWGEGRDSVRFIGTHLSHESESTRMHQAAALKTSLESDPVPAILVGDFNFVQGSGSYGLILQGWLDTARKHGNAQPTFPSTDPKRRIDFVFARPKERWRVISAQVIDEPIISDHCPVLVELELLPLKGDVWGEFPGTGIDSNR